MRIKQRSTLISHEVNYRNHICIMYEPTKLTALSTINPSPLLTHTVHKCAETKIKRNNGLLEKRGWNDPLVKLFNMDKEIC